MKLVFTRNELVTIVKTTMTIPGLMKKFLTDDYIINTFEEKISELNKKTNAVKYIKGEDEYTIALDELFVLELINEFGSLVNAMITLTIGADDRMKMIADKYKVKEDVLDQHKEADTTFFTTFDTSMIMKTILIKKPMIESTIYDTSKNMLVRGLIHVDGLIYHNGKIYEIRPTFPYSTKDIYLINNDEYTVVGTIKPSYDGGLNYIINIDGIDDSSDIWILFFNSIVDMHLFLTKNFKLQ